MIGWRCNSWYAFLPRPTSRQCLFVYSVYTTPGYRRVITVVHHGQLDETACRMPAANCCSRVCWTLMQLWRILILWISDSAFSLLSANRLPVSVLRKFGTEESTYIIRKIVERRSREKLHHGTSLVSFYELAHLQNLCYGNVLVQ